MHISPGDRWTASPEARKAVLAWRSSAALQIRLSKLKCGLSDVRLRKPSPKRTWKACAWPRSSRDRCARARRCAPGFVDDGTDILLYMIATRSVPTGPYFGESVADISRAAARAARALTKAD